MNMQTNNTKISQLRDWRSTPTYCQLQSYVTQKLGQKSKIRPDNLEVLCSNLRSSGHLPAPTVNDVRQVSCIFAYLHICIFSKMS